MNPNDPENLLFETSPYGNLDAIVEHDGRAVFFYLSGQGRADDTFGTRACWVRNLVPGPYVINEDEMKQGIPPALPRTHCKYSDGRAVPKTEQLEIVWFEEGNGAALLETVKGNRKTLAVIPPWSGSDRFHGYADECAAKNQICWPMPDHRQLDERIERAHEFWNSCQSANDHPFVELQKQILNRHRSAWGSESGYFAIDGGQFPPRGLATFEREGRFLAATVGMSLCPQPMVETQVEDPKNYRRVELAIELNRDLEQDAKNQILGQISGLARMPWRQWTWLGPMHTCGFDSLATVLGETAKNVRLERDGVRSAMKSTVEFPNFRGDPIHLLWLVPLVGNVNTGQS